MKPTIPIVTIPRAACPHCGNWSSLKTLRSVADQGDGSTMRRTLCTRCGRIFLIILEPPVLPKFGKS